MLCLPFNEWPEDPKLQLVGKFTRTMMTDSTRGIVWKMLQGSELSVQEIEDLVARTKLEFQDLSMRAYAPL
jgi:hypothetical protein